MNDELQDLLKNANKEYLENFPLTAKFERAIFYSYGCKKGDCAFCYMSIQKKDKPLSETRRSIGSILAEVILCKALNWDIGFFTGGIDVLSEQEMLFFLKAIHSITSHKTWLSVGPLSKEQLVAFKPYIKGIVGSIETVNAKLHDDLCPSKRLQPYEDMFKEAIKLNIDRAMTFIVGVGETKKDLPLLIDFIKKYKINKIHIYGFIPHKGTRLENLERPSKEYHAWWISNIRVAFPNIDIQCGIWEDRLDYIPLLLKAGANSISKLQALKYFGTDIAKQIKKQVELTGRKLESNLLKIPEINWKKEIEKLNLSSDLKKEIEIKLKKYLDSINGIISTK